MENIEVNTQSSIKIIDDKIIYFDPYKIKEKTHDADIIFITHDHYDHFSKEDIDKIINDNTVLVVPNFLKDKIDYKNEVITVKPFNKINVLNYEVNTVPSYNINKPFHSKENNWVGYIIKIKNQKYYIAGDTDLLEENLNIKCDIAFVPIGGVYTMDFYEASDFVNHIKPKTVIPIHYGSIVGDKSLEDDFKSNVNNEIKVVIKIN